MLRWVWLAAVAVALVYAVASEWEGVRAALAGLHIGRVIAATAVGVVGVGVSAQIWRALMSGLGAPLRASAAVRIFFVGQLGKYLPGSVWPVLAQMELGKDHGVPPRTSAAGVALFLWVHLCTGAAVACVLLPAAGAVPAVVALGAPLAVLLLTPGIMGRAISLAVRLTRRQPLAQLPDIGAVAAGSAWALLMWACYGFHLWLLAAGTTSGAAAEPSAVLTTGAFAAAWCLGFLFLVAPAGAGAREAVLVALLPLATGSALAVVVVSRLLLTAADGVWGSVGALSARRR